MVLLSNLSRRGSVPLRQFSKRFPAWTKASMIQSGLANSSRLLSSAADYLYVNVFVTVKPGTEEAFRQASLANARESTKEEGIARFDVIQQVDDPCQFVLVEVYKHDAAPVAHKETDHYQVWRNTVADMMAEPRSAKKYRTIYPGTNVGWDYGAGPLEEKS